MKHETMYNNFHMPITENYIIRSSHKKLKSFSKDINLLILTRNYIVKFHKEFRILEIISIYVHKNILS